MQDSFRQRAGVPAFCALAACLHGCGGVEQAAGADASSEVRGKPVEVGGKPVEMDELPPVTALTSAQFAAAAVSADAPWDGVDRTGAAWRAIEVPNAGDGLQLVRTPWGWLALSVRSFGKSLATESALYRSLDGVHWDSIPIPNPGYLALRSLAYGAGHYVMMGENAGLGVIWTSTDGEHWTEQAQNAELRSPWDIIGYARGLFFASDGFNDLGVSETGENWRGVELTKEAQPLSVAYGNGRYVLVGIGPKLVSQDGANWENSLSESMPWDSVLFAEGEGRFYADQLSTTDGLTWEPLPGRFPRAYVSGHFLSWKNTLPLSELSPPLLQSWTRDADPVPLRFVRAAPTALAPSGWNTPGLLDRAAPFPERVDAEFEDGLDCTNASCVQMGSSLFLVPPLGTPPLPDRLPRRADGSPLLDVQCPVSSMVFCADYAARSGCECHPGAPRSAEDCPQGNQFVCAGNFSPRAEEWRLPEVAAGGCSCAATSPSPGTP